MNEALWKVPGQEEESPYKSYLLYGSSGVQKTRLCAQFPKPLILACDPRKEGGVLTATKDFPNMKWIHVKEYSQLLELIPKLRPLAGVEFETACLDSSTYFHRLIMKNILSYSSKEIARFEDWNLGQTRMRTVITTLSELNCNIVITATENIIKDEYTGKITGVPNVPGQLANELPQAVDVCLRLYTISGYGTDGKKFVKYKMSWVSDDPWKHGKDGTHTLPTEMDTSGKSLEHLWKNKR